MPLRNITNICAFIDRFNCLQKKNSKRVCYLMKCKENPFPQQLIAIWAYPPLHNQYLAQLIAQSV